MLALAERLGLDAEGADAVEAVVREACADAQGLALGSLPTLADFAPVELIPEVIEDTTDHSVSLDQSDRYEDLGLLGTGSMGEVRRVRDRDLNRTLAMKTVLPGVLLQPRVVARFVEEAQATAQLQHPNIVPVHDIGSFEDGRVWFTMREVQGRLFSQVIHEVHEASTDQWLPGSGG